MALSDSRTVNYVFRRSANILHSALLGLPNELLLMILSTLPFWEVVSMSQTCGRLRAIALAHATLWQELPDVVVSQLRTLEPFLDRSRALGFDLAVSQVCPHELAVLCAWMDARFARLRKLRLRIKGLPEDNLTSIHAAEIARLHDTLASAAPLLEDLSIIGTWDEPFLGSLRPDILGGTAPTLRRLELTAFRLDVVCPGLQGATSIIISLGALAPNDTAAQNHRVHALFPAVAELEILGIALERAGAPAARPLARVPAIDAPLASLILCWYPSDDPDEEDAGAAAWLAASAAHVRSVVQDAVHWGSVSEAALAAVVDTARALRIRPCADAAGGLWTEVALEDADRGRARRVHMRRAHAHALLAKLAPRAQGLCIERVVLGSDAQSVGLVRAFPGLWNALPQLRRLRIVVEWPSVDADGWFIAPETLASFAPMKNIALVHIYAAPSSDGRRVDARFILRLLASVFPNARNATVTIPPHSLSNRHVLSGYGGCMIECPPMR